MLPQNVHRRVVLLFPLVAALVVLAISLTAHRWLLATVAVVLMPVELAIGLHNGRRHRQAKSGSQPAIRVRRLGAPTRPV